MIKLRKSGERGFINHGWLKSFHTFSFANYYDPKYMHFGNLRVINEDYIAAGAGFDKHPHDNMEIITYVISGALAHEDSMKNASVIKAGEVQIMSAGKGVTHSEFNHEKDSETHLLQIWILPKLKNIEPRYDQKSFTHDLNKREFVLAVSGSGRDGSLQINQDADVYLAKFPLAKKFDFEVRENRKIWIQLISGKISVNGFELEDGDALALVDEKRINISAIQNSEFLLFDL